MLLLKDVEHRLLMGRQSLDSKSLVGVIMTMLPPLPSEQCIRVPFSSFQDFLQQVGVSRWRQGAGGFRLFLAAVKNGVPLQRLQAGPSPTQARLMRNRGLTQRRKKEKKHLHQPIQIPPGRTTLSIPPGRTTGPRTEMSAFVITCPLRF